MTISYILEIKNCLVLQSACFVFCVSVNLDSVKESSININTYSYNSVGYTKKSAKPWKFQKDIFTNLGSPRYNAPLFTSVTALLIKILIRLTHERRTSL